jgi:hypothetical protein
MRSAVACDRCGLKLAAAVLMASTVNSLNRIEANHTGVPRRGRALASRLPLAWPCPMNAAFIAAHCCPPRFETMESRQGGGREMRKREIHGQAVHSSGSASSKLSSPAFLTPFLPSAFFFFVLTSLTNLMTGCSSRTAVKSSQFHATRDTRGLQAGGSAGVWPAGRRAQHTRNMGHLALGVICDVLFLCGPLVARGALVALLLPLLPPRIPQTAGSACPSMQQSTRSKQQAGRQLAARLPARRPQPCRPARRLACFSSTVCVPRRRASQCSLMAAHNARARDCQ